LWATLSAGVLWLALRPEGRGEASCDDDDEGESSDEGGEKAELAEPNESWLALSERDECGRPEPAAPPGA